MRVKVTPSRTLVPEAREALEEHLELEERFFLPLDPESRVPRVPRARVLATHPARVAQQVRIDVSGERLHGGHGGRRAYQRADTPGK